MHLWMCTKCAYSDHSKHVQSIIWAFALNSYILLYPMILLMDSEVPDQTAWMQRLIWAFPVSIMPRDTFLHGAKISHWSNLTFIQTFPWRWNLDSEVLSWPHRGTYHGGKIRKNIYLNIVLIWLTKLFIGVVSSELIPFSQIWIPKYLG